MSETPRQFPDQSNAKCAIVYTSFCFLPEEFALKWRQGMCAAGANIDATNYRDRIGLDQLTLLNVIRRRDFKTVGTSGWNADDIRATLVANLAAKPEVLLMALPKSMSFATWNNADKAIAMLPEADQQRVTK